MRFKFCQTSVLRHFDFPKHKGGLAWDLSPYFGCLSFYRSIFKISLCFIYKVVAYRPELNTHFDDAATLNTKIYSLVTDTCGRSGELCATRTHAHTHRRARADNKRAKSADSTDRTYYMTPVPPQYRMYGHTVMFRSSGNR